MALLGAYLGLREGLLIILYGLAAAAVWSLIFMFRRKLLSERIHYFFHYIIQLAQDKRIVPYYLRERDGEQAAFCLIPFFWWGFLVRLAVSGGVL